MGDQRSDVRAVCDAKVRTTMYSCGYIEYMRPRLIIHATKHKNETHDQQLDNDADPWRPVPPKILERPLSYLKTFKSRIPRVALILF